MFETGLREERKNSTLMMRHYPDLGRASDWLKQISQAARFSDAICRGNGWWGREMPVSQANGKLEYRHLHKISNKL